MADQEYTIPEPTTAEVNDLAAKIAALDPDGKGVEMRQLRVFYPRIGWGHLMVRLAALKAAGRAKQEMRRGNGPLPVEYWTLSK